MPESRYLSDPRVQTLIAEERERERKRAAKLAEYTANKEFYERPEMQGLAGKMHKYLSGGQRPLDPHTATKAQHAMRTFGATMRAIDPLGGAVTIGAEAAGASPGTAEALSTAAGFITPDPTDLLRVGGKTALKRVSREIPGELTELAKDLGRKADQPMGKKGGLWEGVSVLNPNASAETVGRAQALEPTAAEMSRLAYQQYEHLGGEAGKAIKQSRKGMAPGSKVVPGTVKGTASYNPASDTVSYGGDTLAKELAESPGSARHTAKHEVGHSASKGLREQAPATSSAIDYEYRMLEAIHARKNVDKFEELSKELYGRPGDLENIRNMAHVRAMEAHGRDAQYEEAIFAKLAEDLDAIEKSGAKGQLKKTLDSWIGEAKKFTSRRFEDVEGLIGKEAKAFEERTEIPAARVLQKTKEAARAAPYREPGAPMYGPGMSRLRHSEDEDIADLLATSIEDPRYLREQLEQMREGGPSREALQRFMDEITVAEEDPLADLARSLNVRLK